MSTGNRNGKSVKLWARIPLDLAKDVDVLAEKGESVTAFIIQALRTETDRRKRIKKRSGVSGWA